LGQKCAQHEYSFFLLGAKPGVAERAAAAIQKNAPGLRISGVYHGYFDKSASSPENKMVLDRINSNSTHILLVGFGMPLQEKWLQENWEALQINVALPVGAMFDFLAGETPRGPRWLTDHGFEWLTRLIIEPRRLWRRYLIGIPLFFWRVLLQRVGLLHFD
jgi:N-acetylglucosaminyldiphosphoundecaprenol N-acetyl-beta-D-mannosaminyltransferase